MAGKSSTPKISIINKTNGTFNNVPFERLCDKILGKSYELSIAIVTPAMSRKLNKAHRSIDKSTDVLSWSLSKNSGELVIDPKAAEKKAPEFGMKKNEYMIFIVIHGMLHLKGYAHGSTMEKAEQKYLKFISK